MHLFTALLFSVLALQPLLPDTAADYIEPGQDEPGFRAWIAADPTNRARFDAYAGYLRESGVADVVPAWQLTRTASDWNKCGQPAFEIPPAALWPGIVDTLRYTREAVKPAVGEIEVLSAYRNPYLNSCADGSARSVHRSNSALDMVPRYPLQRGDLMNRLCTMHARYGGQYDAGFGFYSGIRFHVDSWKYRIWGVDAAEGGDQCRIALARRAAARHEQE
ncbi:hypothetical protein WJS89_06560 [Sphingomicrobium sp. XHP0235]|uniref:hypothetical protein n=1 Tax=Sphingomicrobium aquimarinum TaxID=3133971 RepID=UPI0031FE450A